MDKDIQHLINPQYQPCGGCGATEPGGRCLGCLHDFGGGSPNIDPYKRDLPFQGRVDDWLTACFGKESARDKTERNHRFIEEALELVQSGGCTASEAHQLVDYVYGRPVGDMQQEVGGVMNTLAAFCLSYGLDMEDCGRRELDRCWQNIEKIRAKQAAKPKHSPLPEASNVDQYGRPVRVPGVNVDARSVTLPEAMQTMYERRIQELLEANNRYLERARKAEAMNGFFDGEPMATLSEDQKKMRMGLVVHLNDLEKEVASSRQKLRLAEDREQIATRIAQARSKRLQEYRRAAQLVEEWWLEQGMHAFNGAPAAIFETRRLLSEAAHKSSRIRHVRHKKRGSTYRVIGEASLQAATGSDIQEGAKLVVYSAEEDGTLWARPSAEFEDGRFEDIE